MLYEYVTVPSTRINLKKVEKLQTPQAIYEENMDHT
jgi:hypothetical protein